MSSIEQLDILRGAGIAPPQAEAIVRAMESGAGNLVTKEEMRAQLAELENRLTGKLITLGLTITGLVLAGVYFLLNYFKA